MLISSMLGRAPNAAAGSASCAEDAAGAGAWAVAVVHESIAATAANVIFLNILIPLCR
jgi:hypothetical protein